MSVKNLFVVGAAHSGLKSWDTVRDARKEFVFNTTPKGGMASAMWMTRKTFGVFDVAAMVHGVAYRYPVVFAKENLTNSIVAGACVLGGDLVKSNFRVRLETIRHIQRAPTPLGGLGTLYDYFKYLLQRNKVSMTLDDGDVVKLCRCCGVFTKIGDKSVATQAKAVVNQDFSQEMPFVNEAYFQHNCANCMSTNYESDRTEFSIVVESVPCNDIQGVTSINALLTCLYTDMPPPSDVPLASQYHNNFHNKRLMHALNKADRVLVNSMFSVEHSSNLVSIMQEQRLLEVEQLVSETDLLGVVGKFINLCNLHCNVECPSPVVASGFNGVAGTRLMRPFDQLVNNCCSSYKPGVTLKQVTPGLKLEQNGYYLIANRKNFDNGIDGDRAMVYQDVLYTPVTNSTIMMEWDASLCDCLSNHAGVVLPEDGAQYRVVDVVVGCFYSVVQLVRDDGYLVRQLENKSVIVVKLPSIDQNCLVNKLGLFGLKWEYQYINVTLLNRLLVFILSSSPSHNALSTYVASISNTKYMMGDRKVDLSNIWLSESMPELVLACLLINDTHRSTTLMHSLLGPRTNLRNISSNIVEFLVSRFVRGGLDATKTALSDLTLATQLWFKRGENVGKFGLNFKWADLMRYRHVDTVVTCATNLVSDHRCECSHAATASTQVSAAHNCVCCQYRVCDVENSLCVACTPKLLNKPKCHHKCDHDHSVHKADGVLCPCCGLYVDAEVGCECCPVMVVNTIRHVENAQRQRLLARSGAVAVAPVGTNKVLVEMLANATELQPPAPIEINTRGAREPVVKNVQQHPNNWFKLTSPSEMFVETADQTFVRCNWMCNKMVVTLRHAGVNSDMLLGHNVVDDNCALELLSKMTTRNKQEFFDMYSETGLHSVNDILDICSTENINCVLVDSDKTLKVVRGGDFDGAYIVVVHGSVVTGYYGNKNHWMECVLPQLLSWPSMVLDTLDYERVGVRANTLEDSRNLEKYNSLLFKQRQAFEKTQRELQSTTVTELQVVMQEGAVLLKNSTKNDLVRGMVHMVLPDSLFTFALACLSTTANTEVLAHLSDVPHLIYPSDKVCKHMRPVEIQSAYKENCIMNVKYQLSVYHKQMTSLINYQQEDVKSVEEFEEPISGFYEMVDYPSLKVLDQVAVRTPNGNRVVTVQFIDGKKCINLSGLKVTAIVLFKFSVASSIRSIYSASKTLQNFDLLTKVRTCEVVVGPGGSGKSTRIAALPGKSDITIVAKTRDAMLKYRNQGYGSVTTVESLIIQGGCTTSHLVIDEATLVSEYEFPALLTSLVHQVSLYGDLNQIGVVDFGEVVGVRSTRNVLHHYEATHLTQTYRYGPPLLDYVNTLLGESYTNPDASKRTGLDVMRISNLEEAVGLMRDLRVDVVYVFYNNHYTLLTQSLKDSSILVRKLHAHQGSEAARVAVLHLTGGARGGITGDKSYITTALTRATQHLYWLTDLEGTMDDIISMVQPIGGFTGPTDLLHPDTGKLLRTATAAEMEIVKSMISEELGVDLTIEEHQEVRGIVSYTISGERLGTRLKYILSADGISPVGLLSATLRSTVERVLLDLAGKINAVVTSSEMVGSETAATREFFDCVMTSDALHTRNLWLGYKQLGALYHFILAQRQCAALGKPLLLSLGGEDYHFTPFNGCSVTAGVKCERVGGFGVVLLSGLHIAEGDSVLCYIAGNTRIMSGPKCEVDLLATSLESMLTRVGAQLGVSAYFSLWAERISRVGRAKLSCSSVDPLEYKAYNTTMLGQPCDYGHEKFVYECVVEGDKLLCRGNRKLLSTLNDVVSTLTGIQGVNDNFVMDGESIRRFGALYGTRKAAMLGGSLQISIPQSAESVVNNHFNEWLHQNNVQYIAKHSADNECRLLLETIMMTHLNQFFPKAYVSGDLLRDSISYFNPLLAKNFEAQPEDGVSFSLGWSGQEDFTIKCLASGGPVVSIGHSNYLVGVNPIPVLVCSETEHQLVRCGPFVLVPNNLSGDRMVFYRRVLNPASKLLFNIPQYAVEPVRVDRRLYKALYSRALAPQTNLNDVLQYSKSYVSSQIYSKTGVESVREHHLGEIHTTAFIAHHMASRANDFVRMLSSNHFSTGKDNAWDNLKQLVKSVGLSLLAGALGSSDLNGTLERIVTHISGVKDGEQPLLINVLSDAQVEVMKFKDVVHIYREEKEENPSDEDKPQTAGPPTLLRRQRVVNLLAQTELGKRSVVLPEVVQRHESLLMHRANENFTQDPLNETTNSHVPLSVVAENRTETLANAGHKLEDVVMMEERAAKYGWKLAKKTFKPVVQKPKRKARVEVVRPTLVVVYAGSRGDSTPMDAIVEQLHTHMDITVVAPKDAPTVYPGVSYHYFCDSYQPLTNAAVNGDTTELNALVLKFGLNLTTITQMLDSFDYSFCHFFSREGALFQGKIASYVLVPQLIEGNGFRELAGWTQGQMLMRSMLSLFQGSGPTQFVYAAATDDYGLKVENIGFPIGGGELVYDDVTRRVSAFITNVIAGKVTLVTLGSMQPTNLKATLEKILSNTTGPVLLVVGNGMGQSISFRGRPLSLGEELYSVDMVIVKTVKMKLIMNLVSHAHIHGGAGTMQTCQLLGVPTTIHPVAFDQQYNKQHFEDKVFNYDLVYLVNAFRNKLALLFKDFYQPIMLYDVPVSTLKRAVMEVSILSQLPQVRSATSIHVASLVRYTSKPVNVEVDCVWVAIQNSLSPRPTQDQLLILKNLWNTFNVKVNIDSVSKIVGLLLFMGVNGVIVDVATNVVVRLEQYGVEREVSLALTSTTHCDILSTVETSTLLVRPAERADLTDCVPRDEYHARLCVATDIAQLVGEVNTGAPTTVVPGITERVVEDGTLRMSEALKTHIRKRHPFEFYPMSVDSNCCVVDSPLIGVNCYYKCITNHGVMDAITLFDYAISKTVVVFPVSQPVIVSFWLKVRKLALDWPTSFTANASSLRSVACINQTTMDWCKQNNVAVMGLSNGPVDVLYVYSTLNMKHHKERERDAIVKSGDIRVVPHDITEEQKSYLRSNATPRMVVFKGIPYLVVEVVDEWTGMVLTALDAARLEEENTVYLDASMIDDGWFFNNFLREIKSNELHKPVRHVSRYQCKQVEDTVMSLQEALVYFHNSNDWVKKLLRDVSEDGLHQLLLSNSLVSKLTSYKRGITTGVITYDDGFLVLDGYLLVTRVVSGAGQAPLLKESAPVLNTKAVDFESKHIAGQVLENVTNRRVDVVVDPEIANSTLLTAIGPHINDVGAKDFEVVNAEPLALMPDCTPIGNTRFDELPSPVSVEYRHNTEVRDILVWLPTCVGFKINARLAAIKIKEIKTRMLEPYPEFARSSVTKELFSEFNSVSKRQGALTNLAVTKLNPVNEFQLFRALYLDADKLATIKTWDMVGLDTTASRKWLLEHNYPQDVIKTLKDMLLYTFELRTMNQIAVHAKVEQTTKISAAARWVEDVSARSILASSYAIAAIFSPVFLNLKKRLQYCLVDKVVYVDGMSSPQLSTYLRSLKQPQWYVEDDLTAQDRQTTLEVIELEKMIYIELGCIPEVVEFYLTCHRHWSWKGFGIRGVWDAMRLTGQVTTALGNAITNLLVHMRFYHRNQGDIISYLLLGDDCLFLMESQADVKRHGTEVAQLYNMESKVQQRRNVGGFLSMIVGCTDGVLNVYPHIKRLRHRLSICNYTFTELDLVDKVNQRKISYCNMLCGFSAFRDLCVSKFSVKPVDPWYQGSAALLANALFDETTEGQVMLHLDAMSQMVSSDEVLTDVVKVFSK